MNMNNVLSFVSIVLLLCGILLGCGSSEEEETRISGKQAPEDTLSKTGHVQESVQSSPLPSQVVAIVNGEEITTSELVERLHVATSQLDKTSAIDQYTLNRLRENALQEIVNKRLIAQKATEQNVTVTDEEFQQLVQQVQEEYTSTDIRQILQDQGQSYDEWERDQREALLLEKLIDLNMTSLITVSPDEIRQYYERNQEKYDHSAQVRASQILVYDESTARTALEDIRSGIDFGSVAEKYSESPDANAGGDLGFFDGGTMPPEFDEVIFSLNMGEVSDIVKTPYGYQIFKLTGQREAHRVSFEEVKTSIEQMLKKQKRMFAIDLWMVELQNNAKIVLNHSAIKQVK